MTPKQRYTIIPADAKVTKRTAASHLRAAEMYARRRWPHAFLIVRRVSGEGQANGEFQAYHQADPVGYPFMVCDWSSVKE